MTLTTSSIKAVAQGNSATTVWPYTFLIPALADLVVTLVDVASGNETVVNPVNYSVSGLGNAGGLGHLSTEWIADHRSHKNCGVAIRGEPSADRSDKSGRSLSSGY